MKKTIFILLITAFFTPLVHAKAIKATVNENIELMSILSRLAGYSEYSMDMGGQYMKDIDASLGRFGDHAAVSLMKEIRKNEGISYDAVMSMALNLEYRNKKFALAETEVPMLDKRWRKVDKENFLTQLTAFYHETKFHDFFLSHKAYYEEGIKVFTENILNQLNQSWYTAFYGAEPVEEFRVCIGFCNGGGNYGPARHLKDQPKEVFAIVGYVEKDGKPRYENGFLSVLVHEFCHSFTNHLLEKETRVEELEASSKLIREYTSWSMKAQAYDDWKTIINESLVRAAVICYMQENNAEDKDIRKQLTYELSRNYFFMPELVQLLHTYQKNRDTYPTLDAFYPEIIRFFNEVVGGVEKRIDAITIS